METIQHKRFSVLPTSKDEMNALGWEQADIIIVSGDAYVDHPSFGTAVMARLGEYYGLKVAVLPQPNWRDDLRDFKKLGQPNYFFGVTAGCMDSMVNHYTAAKRKRSDDAYTPGGKAGFRPDYAVTVYTSILKKLFPETPVVLGGIEASLRRFSHYDYWSDSVKQSILINSGADILLYGMAEKAFAQVIQLIGENKPLSEWKKIRQCAYVDNQKPMDLFSTDSNDIFLPSHSEQRKSKKKFGDAFRIQENLSNHPHHTRIIEEYNNQYVISNPPFEQLSESEIDLSFDLPYSRLPHPRYKNKPPIPAFEMIKNSVTIHRGCFGGCAFCAIRAHQGKFIASRSAKSVLNEVKLISETPGFSGHISDMGGPSANMYSMHGMDQKLCFACKRPSCIFPSICKNLNFNHKPLISLYQNASLINGINKITIGSGIRYDLLVNKKPELDKEYGLTDYLNQLISKHVSGRLKVAPEHINDEVLNLMRKPSFSKFRAFHNIFYDVSRKNNLKQELVLYLIAGHPGSTDNDMDLLSKTTKAMGFGTEPVQEFTPTPMTLSTCLYYTGIHPLTGENISVVKGYDAVRKQKSTLTSSEKRYPTSEKRRKKRGKK